MRISCSEIAREGGPEVASRKRAHRRALVATAAAVAIALAALLYLNDRPSFAIGRGTATQGVTTLAILPLVNATGDPALDYLADGITESVIN